MQGFNMGRYVPPEHEGTVSANKLHNKKPPGFHGGKQTVRFEMPFNIFCLHCEGHIAQGVRFNAEKAKVGNYFSTPIFSFRMKHTVCSGLIEIRTDPKNTAYVVTEGAKKKAGDDVDPGIIKIRGPDDIGTTSEDPFARAEKTATDKSEVKLGAARIAELRKLSDKQWADPYEHSRKVRRIFREERNTLKAKIAAAEAIQERTGLGIDILDEQPEDAQIAKLVEFGRDRSEDADAAQSKPLFSSVAVSQVGKRDESKASDPRESLQRDLQRNTRMRVDPFLSGDRQRPELGLPLLKRKGRLDEKGLEQAPEQTSKQIVAKVVAEEEANDGPPGATSASLGLDDYDSED